MAEVKDGDIIFEYPDDDEITGSKISDEKEVDLEPKQAEPKKEAKVQDELDLEIEDDTPPEDRNRDPLPKEVIEEVENDDLTSYSDKVKTRLSQLRKMHHDERRAKEAADRERQEAIRFAQQLAEERDKIIEAQSKMNDTQLRLAQANNYVTQFKTPLQEPEKDVYIQQNQQSVPKPDSKALDWQDKNEWFGKDEEMTALAFGLHEKLVRSGINPTSDEYYRRIDSTMQKRFPEYFGDATLDEETPAQRTKPSNVVAPATRSTAPKKVRLTKTQVALAKKFGLTPEQYARETLKLENANG